MLDDEGAGASTEDPVRKWLPLIAVCLGTFMLLVDVTIVNVAVPAMAAELETSLSSLQWVIDGYALALAALMIGIGGLADRVGHRATYLAGLAVFALASVTCGVAPDPATLIASRALQGVGGAAMIAPTFALLNSSYAGRDRGVAYGVWGAVSGASSAVGPLIGGPLTEYLSWRWIFFVNLPVSVVALVMGVLALPHTRAGNARRFDVVGFLIFTAAISALTYGLIRAGEYGWDDPVCAPALGIGAVSLLAFLIVEARTAEPLLEPALLRHRVFSGVLIAAAVLNFAAYVSLTYSSIWMQSVLGLSPVIAGLVAVPMSGAAFVVSAVLGRVMYRLRPGRVIGVGILLVGLGDLLGVALVQAWASWQAMLPAFFVVGLGIGLAAPPLNSTGTTAVPAERGGMAGGAIYTARQVGFAFGIALLGSAFTAGAHHSLAARDVGAADSIARDIAGARSAEVLGSVPAASRDLVDEAVRAAAANGMVVLLAVAGIVGVVGALLSFVMLGERTPPGSAAESRPPRVRRAREVG